MRERPILFSYPMVQAILAGHKTQTRRIVKSKDGIIMRPIHALQSEMQEHLELLGWRPLVPGHVVMPCPYGQPGDRLWVRETLYQEGDGFKYAADALYHPNNAGKWKWKNDYLPSIHMPRWASRITLEITSVRVERLQDITEDDAIAEGLKICPNMNGMGHTGYVFPDCDYDKAGLCHSSPWTAFYQGWEMINGPDSWDANPWVWVLNINRLKVE